MSISNGGPAFPTVDANRAEDYGTYGMTLRDYFAAKAIPTAFNVDVLMHSKEELGANGAMDLCAKMAWKIADAMLAAREAKS